MKKNIIIHFILLLPTLLVAQSGKVFDELSMTSKILGGERKYAIYLPPDYESSQRSYPVLYLLHGGGSYIYALHRPDLFSSACPLSAGTGPLTLEATQAYITRRGGGDTSDEQVQAYFKQYSVMDLVKNMPEDQKEEVRWFIDCGDDDFLFEGNSLIHIEMRKREIPHEYRVRQGGHSWTYWRESLPKVLSFVSEAFHQH